MVRQASPAQMIAYWKGHGFKEVVLVDAEDFDDTNQASAYADSSYFLHQQRLAFAAAVLAGVDKAAKSALGGTLTAFIIKQMKGTGVHTVGAKSHNLYPADSLDKPHMIEGLQRRALNPEAWAIVRENFVRAGGGPAVKTSVTEHAPDMAPLGKMPLHEFARGEKGCSCNRDGRAGGLCGHQGQAFRRDQCRRQRSLRDEEHQ